MTRYRCRIANSKGRISHVIKTSGSPESLVKEIHKDSMFLVSFSELKPKRTKKFSKRIILDFTDTMALMLRSGLSVYDALTVSTGDLPETISRYLMRGYSFPEAVNKLDSDFSPLYRGLVKIGDSTGSMDHVFEKLSRYLSDEKEMREKILNALLYPSLVLTVLFLGIVAVYFLVLPKIRKAFFAVSLDSFINRFQLTMVLLFTPLVLMILFTSTLIILTRLKGLPKKFSDEILLRIPLIGKIILLKSTVNLMFSMEVLTSGGYPLEEALEDSTSVLSNSHLFDALCRIRFEIIGGDKLSSAFHREIIFPSRISHWISIGEASGDITSVFSQLRTYFQGELDHLTSGIMMLIEPVLIVLVGIFMILFVLFFVVPLLGMFGNMV